MKAQIRRKLETDGNEYRELAASATSCGDNCDVDLLVRDESTLADLAAAISGNVIDTVTKKEAKLLTEKRKFPLDMINSVSNQIANGDDPLGQLFCALRSPSQRRNEGAVYTPQTIVNSMLSWAEYSIDPAQVIDPGSGSARFLIEAGRRFPNARLIAIEKDPLAALTARANLVACGMYDRSEVLVEDFLTTKLRNLDGATFFVGNPPYVRHHLIQPKWKQWLKNLSDEMGLQASALAGLHVYFFLAIAQRGKNGDCGALITAAEWLDVNYGKLVRDLFLERLGGQSIHVIEPNAEPFPGTATTAAITTFAINERPRSVRLTRIKKLNGLLDLSRGGRRVRRERLESESRWSHFTRTRIPIPHGYVELGEICRVHRGQVTGANNVWIAGEHSEGLPDEVLFPTVTRAKELFQAGPVLDNSNALRRVIDLPRDLSSIQRRDRSTVIDFLKRAEQLGVRNSYTAQHRLAWWSVRLREPAPILATYMARRAPAFVLNKVGARHLNIAHGLYPREEMSTSILSALVSHLRATSTIHGGRMYAGGLTKFEPREMERIAVPRPDVLAAMDL